MPAVICLDDEASISSSFPFSNPTSNIMPDNLAYVIYTSGSTGQPKGAMITHRGLLNYLLWAVHAYEVAEGNGAPLVSSIAFDLTVTSLFTPLLAGRSVTLLPKNVKPEVLGHVLDQKHSYSLVKITPAHLEILNQQVSAHRAAHCTRFFVIGGEQIYFHTLEYWRANAPATRLINEYGPTETVVGCCTYEVQPGDPVDGPVPIGRPIANTQLYVLDHYMQPVPPGVPGELYIGGAGVARGYLARPELTAERFVPNPFAGPAGERLYKTGDLVRYRADGVLEFLGRSDHQVKLRGFRIELGEIETVLHRHPTVQDCVVVMREETPGEKRLVAYVVLTQEGEEASPDLRAHLRASLPEYMLPTFLVILPALPFSTNGKVNRQALPSPEPDQLLKNDIVNASISHAQSKVAAEHIAPRDDIERQIAIIWQSLLGFDAIGIYDDFFEVGGHSLLLTQLVSRLSNEFQVNIQLVEVFERRTIASMAILVIQAQAEFVDADILAALLDEIEDSPKT